MKVKSIIQPKRPNGEGWVFGGNTPASVTLGYEGEYWLYPSEGITVISAVEVARDPGDIEKGPEYHVSVSQNRARIDRNGTRFVLKAFDMTDADEDNHVPNGFVRNFWMPVAEHLRGHVCPCKNEEPAMVEDKGDFIWRGITK